LTRLRTLFGWALDKELIATDPTAGVRHRAKEKARDRALEDDEIICFWAASDQMGWPFGPLFKLLLLTAQRENEVGGMRWDEVNLNKRTWTIPRERAKSNRAHVVHLSDLALEILTTLPRTGEIVFSATGRTPVSGYSRAKERLDARMLADLIKQSGNPEAAIAPWILHDLRRTATTGMAKLGIAPHVVDKILNHSAGTIRGVAAVYNRFSYLPEREAALGKWGAQIATLMGPDGGAAQPAPENKIVRLLARVPA
jgi:integrase